MKQIMNFHRLGALILPVCLRGQRMIAMVRVLVFPLYTVQSLFLDHYQKTIYKINHNGQVCSLQGVLNDTFDSTLRRIKIKDPIRNNFLMVYKREEQKEIYLGRKIISRRDSIAADQCDFLVKVPFELKNIDNETQLRSLLNFYKLAGKLYSIDYE